jgi:hypothetical protein
VEKAEGVVLLEGEFPLILHWLHDGGMGKIDLAEEKCLVNQGRRPGRV